MKTLITFSFFVAFLGTISSAQENTEATPTKADSTIAKSDTTRIQIGKTEVLVIEDKSEGGKTKVEINKVEKEKEPKNNKSSKADLIHWSGFELGVNTWINKDGNFGEPSGHNYLELNEAKSLAINLNMFEKSVRIIGDNLQLVSGLGLSWNNYRFRKDITLYSDSSIIGANYDEEDYRKNKLTVSYLTVPLLLEFNSSSEAKKSFHVSAGVVGGLRLGSHTKQVKADGTKLPKIKDDFNMNPFRYDATVRIGFGNYTVFGSYALNSMFRDGQGPELYPFTAGIVILNM